MRVSPPHAACPSPHTAGTAPEVALRTRRGPAAPGPARAGAMKVKVISVLEDNYMYLVIEESTRQAVAVDAAVPKRVSGVPLRGGVAVASPR